MITPKKTLHRQFSVPADREADKACLLVLARMVCSRVGKAEIAYVINHMEHLLIDGPVRYHYKHDHYYQTDVRHTLRGVIDVVCEFDAFQPDFPAGVAMSNPESVLTLERCDPRKVRVSVPLSQIFNEGEDDDG